AAPGGFANFGIRVADGKDRARQLGMKRDQLAADKPMEMQNMQEARKMLKDEAPAREQSALAGRIESLKKAVMQRAGEEADRDASADFAFFGAEAAKASRGEVRAYYRQLGPTKEWAENNYYR